MKLKTGWTRPFLSIWFVGMSVLWLWVFLTILTRGSITLYEDDTAILYSEIILFFLFIYFGLIHLCFDLKKALRRRARTGTPFISGRKLQNTGTAYTISIPREWFKNGNIDPAKIGELTLVVGENLVVLNPHGRLVHKLAKHLTERNMTFERLKKVIKRK